MAGGLKSSHPFSGFGYFAGGLAGFAEAMAQAVHGLPVHRGLFASHRRRPHRADRHIAGRLPLPRWWPRSNDRLEAVIPNCPVVTPKTMFDEWFPANKLVDLGLAG